MKSDLELALECVINIYHRYAPKNHPIDDFLSKTEFTQLLKENAQPFLLNTKPPSTSTDDYIKQLFAKADHNRDGRLKFTEFLTTLSLIYIDAHNRSHQDHKSHDRPSGGGPGHDHGHGHDHDHGHGHGHGHGPRN